MILMNLFTGCQSNSNREDTTKDNKLKNEVSENSNSLYLSFTVTHAVEDNEDTFESDIYYYGLKEKK